MAKAAKGKPGKGGRGKKSQPAAGGVAAVVAVSAEAYTVAPEVPAELGEYGRAYWERIAPLLVDRRVLTPLHLEPLLAMCDQWDTYQRLSAWLREDPARWTFQTETGYESESPQVRMMGSALKELQRLWAKFGLTPYAEERVSVTKKTQPRGSRVQQLAGEKTAHDEENRP
jgi:P27 family predicted phage terminase small subunit